MTLSRRFDEQPPDTVTNLARFERSLPDLRERYQSARPFPHIVLDDLLAEDVVRRAEQEFPAAGSGQWANYIHVNEKKFSNTDMPSWGPTLQAVAKALNSNRFVRFLEALTGADDLIIDESMEGGGLHQSLAGGFLNVHADFTVHPRHREWHRRVNLLLYLNEGWATEYGGHLELWSQDMKRCEQSIAPLGNRAVIFNTDPDSFHGHPEPLKCPDGVARRSMALYYFTEEERPMVRSTEYRARPGEGPRSALIYLDKEVLRTYDRLKRRLGLSDRTVSHLLGPRERFRRWRKQSHRSGG